MTPKRLTQTIIDKLELPTTGRLEIRDTDPRGLMLRVTIKGIKSWYVVRQMDGKRQRLNIGTYPVMTLAKARAKAKELLGAIEQGADLQKEAEAKETSNISLDDCLKCYLKHRSASSKPLKPRSEKQYNDTIRLYSADWLEFKLANITEANIVNRHRAISNGEVKRQRGPSKAQADLWGRIIRALFNFASREYKGAQGEQIFTVPTTVLTHNKQWHHIPRKQTHIRKSQLGQMLDGLDRFRQEYPEDTGGCTVADGIMFAMFTGLRKGEVLGLTWDRIDLSGGYFWIDETKNGQPLELPITDTAKQIFTRRNKARKGDFVFSNKEVQIADTKKALKRISNYIELHFTWHDCRRTFASNAELAGVGTYSIKRLMNHKTKRDDVTAGYIVQTADELERPATNVEQGILSAAGRIQEPEALDKQLLAALTGADDNVKRKLLFTLMNSSNTAQLIESK
jgi:integrase